MPPLANWAKPKLVVSCQTALTSERQSVKMYERMGAKFLGTWPHGSVTIRPDDPEALVESNIGRSCAEAVLDSIEPRGAPGTRGKKRSRVFRFFSPVFPVPLVVH